MQVHAFDHHSGQSARDALYLELALDRGIEGDLGGISEESREIVSRPGLLAIHAGDSNPRREARAVFQAVRHNSFVFAILALRVRNDMFDDCLVHRVEDGLVDVCYLSRFVAGLQSCSYDMTDDFTIIIRQSIPNGHHVILKMTQGARHQHGAQTLLSRVMPRAHGRQQRPFAPGVSKRCHFGNVCSRREANGLPLCLQLT